MLRDTAAQDRLIERPSLWKRHRLLLAASLAAAAAVCVLVGFVLRYSGTGASVDRAQLSIAAVERGSFVRDIAADGQVVAAGSPTLYANALGTVALKVHAGDAVSKGQVMATVDSPDLNAKLSQEDATLAGLRLDWQRAMLDAERRLSQLPAEAVLVPAPAVRAQVMQAEQAQAQHHEREGDAVVQAPFAGQAEAQAVAVAGLQYLDIGGQNRVGGREDGAEQDGGAQRKTQAQHPEYCNQHYRDRHRNEGESHRQAPAPVRQG